MTTTKATMIAITKHETHSYYEWRCLASLMTTPCWPEGCNSQQIRGDNLDCLSGFFALLWLTYFLFPEKKQWCCLLSVHGVFPPAFSPWNLGGRQGRDYYSCVSGVESDSWGHRVMAAQQWQRPTWNLGLSRLLWLRASPRGCQRNKGKYTAPLVSSCSRCCQFGSVCLSYHHSPLCQREDSYGGMDMF